MLIQYVYTPIGQLGIGIENECVVALDFKIQGERSNHPLLKEAIRQIEAYFDGKLQQFDLPLNPQGSIFHKRVWEELCKIPYGEVRSYKDIALALKNPRASRAVGNANNKNPIIIIVPCHRVVAQSYYKIGLTQRSLGGYALGVDVKKYLLTLEGLI